MKAVLMLCVAVLATLSFAGSAAGAGPRYVGVQVHSLWEGVSPDQMRRELDAVRGLGANVVRLDIGWSSLQPTGPKSWSRWYLDRLDGFFAAARHRGIKVIAMLMETPCWASTAPAHLKRGCTGEWWTRDVQEYAPADPARYGVAAGFLTNRYERDLAALEIWNEPNRPEEFFTDDKVGRYAALVRATYPRAKAGSRTVPVLAGSTSYADVPFLRGLWRAGMRGYYDGISIHPYSYQRSPTDTTASEEHSFLAGIRAVMRAQDAVGDRKPLWLTEWGWTSFTRSGVSLALQARYTRESLLLLGALRRVRGATVYQLRDMAVAPWSWEDNFGLLRHDFSRRPAYGAMRSALASMRRAPATNSPTDTMITDMTALLPGG